MPLGSENQLIRLGKRNDVSHQNKMPELIRRVDLRSDRQILMSFLSENLPASAGTPSRLEWLYNANPMGPAIAWIALDEKTGEAIGASALFPRKFRCRNQLRNGFVFGDFCVAPRYRSLGLALRLQRASLRYLQSMPDAIACDFPSSSMMAIYQRLDVPLHGREVRWSKPLRLQSRLLPIVKSSFVARTIASPLDLFLRARDAFRVSNPQWTVSLFQGTFTSDFTHLAEQVGARYGICTDRSAAYLNWRYFRHPSIFYETIAVWENSRLRGYLIFSHTGQNTKVVDILAFEETSLWTSLIAEAVSLARSRGAATISVPVLENARWRSLLSTAGFFERESYPVMICGPAAPDPNSSWFIMDGDRES